MARSKENQQRLAKLISMKNVVKFLCMQHYSKSKTSQKTYNKPLVKVVQHQEVFMTHHTITQCRNLSNIEPMNTWGPFLCFFTEKQQTTNTNIKKNKKKNKKKKLANIFFLFTTNNLLRHQMSIFFFLISRFSFYFSKREKLKLIRRVQAHVFYN